MGCGRQGRLCVHPCLRGTLAIAVRVRPDRLSPNTIRACCGNLLVRFTAAHSLYAGKLLDDHFALEDRYPYSWVRYP